MRTRKNVSSNGQTNVCMEYTRENVTEAQFRAYIRSKLNTQELQGWKSIITSELGKGDTERNLNKFEHDGDNYMTIYCDKDGEYQDFLEKNEEFIYNIIYEFRYNEFGDANKGQGYFYLSDSNPCNIVLFS